VHFFSSWIEGAHFPRRFSSFVLVACSPTKYVGGGGGTAEEGREKKRIQGAQNRRCATPGLTCSRLIDCEFCSWPRLPGSECTVACLCVPLSPPWPPPCRSEAIAFLGSLLGSECHMYLLTTSNLAPPCSLPSDRLAPCLDTGATTY
jgi:hypothetical protein